MRTYRATYTRDRDAERKALRLIVAQSISHITGDTRYPTRQQNKLLRGTPVVYVLMDDEDVPCYIGSSINMPERLRGEHRRDSRKPFVRWLAFKMSDEQTARAVESQALMTYKPYSNVRAAA